MSDFSNRLSSSSVFTNINTTTNQWQSGAGINPTAYATDYTDDAMGNILTQKRNGGGTSATALDVLTYNYHTTTDGLVSNRLYQVNDVVSAGNYTDDIDDQGTFNNTHSTIETANNYGYDELGNLVRDVQEEIASIEWTVYGKMKKIIRNSASSKADLEFGYDASGNRLWKKVTPKGSGAVISTYYYLRDAQGNEMCRYVKYTNTSSQLMYVAQEHSIYGSSRVGVDNRKDTLYLGAVYSPSWGGANTSRRALGLKSFELANHLGNVLVTVSDKPVYKVSSTTIFFQPEVSSISDYYPFGAPINGRSAAFGNDYRFGFNTQEKTDEISGPGNHNTATFWEYDIRLVLRWNQDPKIVMGVSPYAINGDNPIFYTDPNGDFKTWFSAQLYKYSHGGRGYVSKANSGIHKREWSVSQKVHREGGAEGNENRIGDVLIVQQVRWSWWQGGKTKNTQSKGGDNFWNTTAGLINSYTSPKVDFVGGAAENKIGQILLDRGKYGSLHPETIIRTQVANISVSTKLLQNTGTALKWGGRAFGAVGLVGTYAQWQTGAIGNTQAALDATFGSIGFLPGYGWAVSGTYFLIARPLYNYSIKP